MEEDTQTQQHSPVPAPAPAPEIRTWEDMQLKEDLLRGIFAYGFETPSEIQKKAIVPFLTRRDIFGQAQSGTGKTGTFSISTLQLIDPTVHHPQAIILLPTHELVSQVYTVITSLSQFMEGVRIKTMVGGTSINDDIKDLKSRPPHIIIGCTGRVLDMLKRGALKSTGVRICVMDEADEMLSAGFKEQIYGIFQLLPNDVQIALFSATMPEPIMKLTERFMRDPIKITMLPEQLSLDGINQYFIAVRSDPEKFDQLKALYSSLSVTQSIIYVNSVPRVIELYDAMCGEGYSVCALHSDMSKADRKRIIDSFRTGSYRVLISSNLTARGIDIQQVSMVVNFDIPKSVDTYLHRIGRSGRWGRKGTAINFITRNDINTMRMIERHYKISINEYSENQEN